MVPHGPLGKNDPEKLFLICIVHFELKVCLRSYPGESTRSHLNSEVKHLWAWLVEWWVTTFESLVLKTFLFFLFLFLFFVDVGERFCLPGFI